MSHAFALRGLVEDNAISDVRQLIKQAVSRDEDVAYGLFVSPEGHGWAYVSPGQAGGDEESPALTKVLGELNLRPNDLGGVGLQRRSLSAFGQDFEEFRVNVVGEDGTSLAKGPLSALYGANAFLATVNVITREPEERKVQANQRFWVTNGNPGWGASGLAQHSGIDTALLLSVSYDRIDRSGVQARQTYEFQDLRNVALSEPSRDDIARPGSVFGRLSYFSDHAGEFTLEAGYQELDSKAEFQLNSLVTHRSRVNVHNSWAALHWRYELDKLGLLVATSEGRPERNYELFLTSNPNQSFKPRFDYRALNALVEASYDFGPWLSGEVGVDTEVRDEGVLYYRQVFYNEAGRQAFEQRDLLDIGGVTTRDYRQVGPYLQLRSAPFAELPDFRLTLAVRGDWIDFGPISHNNEMSVRGLPGDLNGDGTVKISTVAVEDAFGIGFQDAMQQVMAVQSPSAIFEKTKHPMNADLNQYNWSGAIDQLTDAFTGAAGDVWPDVIVEFTFPQFSLALVKAYSSTIPFLHTHSMREQTVVLSAEGRLEGQEGTSYLPSDGPSGQMFDAHFRESIEISRQSQWDSAVYDGAFLFALGTLVASQGLADPSSMTGAMVRDAMRGLNDPEGEVIRVGPEEFAKGALAIAAGRPINYEGASGPCDFDAHGRAKNRISHWRVLEGQAIDIAVYDCVVGESCPKQ